MHADPEQQETQKEIKSIVVVGALCLSVPLLTLIAFFLFNPMWTLAESTWHGRWPALKNSLQAILVSGTFLVTMWYAVREGRILLGYAKRKEKTGAGAREMYGVEKAGGKSLLKFSGIILLIAAGLWGLWWVYQQANQPPESYAVERVAAPVPVPPAPEFIFTNQYGLRLVRTFEVFTTKAGETNGPIRVVTPGAIKWGTWDTNNLSVFLNGQPIPATAETTNRVLVGNYTFTAKSDAVEYWVATGLSHRVRD